MYKKVKLYLAVLILCLSVTGLTQAKTPVNQGQLYTHVSTYDGDTSRFRNSDGREERIRYYCIDAPEIKQPYGIASRDRLREIINKADNVNLVLFKTKSGKWEEAGWGRLLGEVFVDGKSANLQLVREGLAFVYNDFCNEKRFYQAQEEAKAEKRGAWKNSQITKPWEFRRKK